MPVERQSLDAVWRKIEQSRAEREKLAAAVRVAPLDARSELRERIHGQRQTERAAKDELRTILDRWLPPDPGTEVSRLPASHPIALMPLRLETRFVGRKLKIRIYPDAIFANIHEPLVTDAERAYGEAYFSRVAAGMSEADSWSVLVKNMTPERAAWVLRVTDPAASGPAPTRPSDWGRFPESRALPDRFVVVAHRGRTVRRQAGRTVEQPLALALRLNADSDDGDTADAVALTEDGLRIDRDLAWAFDYQRAEEVGLAVTLDLSAEELEQGFDRIVVYGVKASETPESGASLLRELFDAHHYSRGVAFVPQGTPTNNTTGAPAAYPRSDPDGRVSFAVERGPKISSGDGIDLVRALGLPAEVVEHVEHAGIREQARSRAMNAALWPATLGYFLEQMMAPVAGEGAIAWIHEWVLEHVRGRGHFPAFRIGAVPYGFLPVTSLERYAVTPQPRGELVAEASALERATTLEAGLAQLCRTLRRIWRQTIPTVARVGRGDPDEDLLQALALDASTREVFLRAALGRETQWNLLGFLGLPFGSWDAIQQSFARAVMTVIGHPDWSPRILGLNYDERTHRITHDPLDRANPKAGLELVAEPPLSEVDGLPVDYIRWIARDATFQTLHDNAFPGDDGPPRALLYAMLRHAMLEEYRRAGYSILRARDLVSATEMREMELVHIAPTKAVQVTPVERLTQPVAGVTANLALAAFLDKPEGLAFPGVRLQTYRGMVSELEGIPTAELERLFTESLDIASHRLDAWIGSLAHRRLRELRAQRPDGVHLGAYGWVENLRPRSRSVTEGGFVHAPSMNHAAAAAVLRSAYLSRTGEDRKPYGVDLSSRRVRRALELLDGVRQGQPLGALLGYRFERGLHEGHPGQELDRYIDEFRALCPLVANKATSGSAPDDEPAEAVAARNVVDGLSLLRKARAGAIPWGSAGFPATGAPRAAIEAEIAGLEEAVDGLADLLLAESVYHLVSGATDAAGASLDAMAMGHRPPEPEVVHVPRRSTQITERVAIVLGGDPLAGGAYHNPVATPRARANMVLNAWVGRLLGAPNLVRCRVEFRPTLNPETLQTRVVRLSDLGLEPLDVLALVQDRNGGNGESELDRRIAWVVADQVADVTQVHVVYAVDDIATASERSFLELLEVARAVNSLLAASRPLRPADLLPPGRSSAADTADVMPAEMATRVSAAIGALEAAISDLNAALAIGPVSSIPDSASPDLTPLRNALRRASLLGVAGAFPRTRVGYSRAALVELFAQAVSVRKELAKRREAALAESDPELKLKAVFGRDFMAIPRFVPVNDAEFTAGLASPPTLLDGGAIERFLAQATRIRKGVGALRRVELYRNALSVTGASPRRILQLPHQPGAHWIGDMLPANETLTPGSVSVLLEQFQAPGPAQPWAGLLVDEWVEDVPERVDNTGVTFHFDSPGAEAPQAVLLAVPATRAEYWDRDTLEAVLDETLDLAKIRAVDSELVGVLGQLLPAVFLADNPAKATISTSFLEFLATPGFRIVTE